MLLKIIGWFWILTGILFFMKPELLRNRLKKKSYKQIRGWLFGIALIVGFLLIGAAWNSEGPLAKVVIIFGIIAVFKAFFFLKAKAARHVFEWFLKQPVWFFRIWAGLQVGFGVVLLRV